MSSLTKPNGPLPENTYWRRRAIVLAVALLLVVGLGRLFTGGSDGADPASATASDSAALVSESEGASSSAEATESAPSPSAATGSAESSESAGAKSGKKKAAAAADAEASEEPTPAATVEPRGECLPSDISVEPLVADQDAGRDIKVRLKVQTTDAVACLWKPSKDTLTLKITSGSDNIWFSSQCPKEMPNDSVVLRNDKPTQVRMTWDARRSDEGCTKERKWALPGTYHLEAAALGGDPQDARFVLETPTPETVQPKPKATKKSDKKADEKSSTTKNKKNDKKKNNKKSND